MNTRRRLGGRIKERARTISGLLLVSALVSSLVVSTPAQSRTIGTTHQQTADGVQKNSTENQAALDRQRALQMLDHLFEDTNNLAPDVNKAYLQIRIADTLWEYNEPRARSRFESAFRTAGSIKDDSSSQYRGDVLEAIKQHDPNWAKKLALDYWKTKKQEPDIWTIMVLIDVDNQYAIQLIQREIDGNNPRQLKMLLTKVRARNPQQADDLFTYALSAAERKSNRLLDDFHMLVGYAFPSKPVNQAYAGNYASPLKSDLITRFLDFGFKALIREADLIERESSKSKRIGERSGYGYMELQGYLPLFDRYTPDHGAKLRARWDELILGLQGGKEHTRQVKLFYGPMTKQDSLRNAEETNNQVERQALYLRAASLAANEGSFDEAISILTRFAAETGADLNEWIYGKAAEAAIAKGDSDAAHHYAEGVKSFRERTKLLCGIARMLQGRKDTSGAVQVLKEALDSAQQVVNDWQKPGAMLAVAGVATLIEPARGFELVNQAVELINRAEGFAQSVGDFDESLLLLARVDFDRALSLTQKLDKNESRLIARIAVCRGILSKQ